MMSKLGPCICDVCNIHCHYTFTYSSKNETYTFIASCHGELDRCVIKVEDLKDWDFVGLRAFTKESRGRKLINLTSTAGVKEPFKDLLCIEYKSKLNEGPSLRPVGTSPDKGGPESWGYKLANAL